jgi:uncharacterized membrane protein YphA (DoxX/SURF4 family)
MSVLTIVSWVLQVLLALMFLMAGSAKAFQPLDKVAKRMMWVSKVPAALVRFIGIAELLGAIGLILPALIGIVPVLTIAAAIGLALIMLFAIIFHVSRGENNVIVVNIILLVLLIVVIYARLMV